VSEDQASPQRGAERQGKHYKWIALSNTTLGVLNEGAAEMAGLVGIDVDSDGSRPSHS
jgi:hypothetical protein